MKFKKLFESMDIMDKLKNWLNDMISKREQFHKEDLKRFEKTPELFNKYPLYASGIKTQQGKLMFLYLIKDLLETKGKIKLSDLRYKEDYKKYIKKYLDKGIFKNKEYMEYWSKYIEEWYQRGFDEMKVLFKNLFKEIIS